MRISKAVWSVAVVAALGAAGPALAFDLNSLQQETPAEAFRLGFAAYQQGDTNSAVMALENAASRGHPIAQWKLGQMYAVGDGVTENDREAFRLFAEIANAYADESPTAPSAPFVANAFTSLGVYFRDGIPDTDVQPNSTRARQMFSYAASYFGDPQAQLALAQMYYDGTGGPRDPRQAARWAKLAADKGNPGAQALLGHLLFQGEGVQRQPVLGLMYLIVASQHAGAADDWVRVLQEQAFSIATETERRTALALAESWGGDEAVAGAGADVAAAAPAP